MEIIRDIKIQEIFGDGEIIRDKEMREICDDKKIIRDNGPLNLSNIIGM